MREERWNHKLRRRVAENYANHRCFAAELGVSERTVRSWLRGKNIPNERTHERIFALIGTIEFPGDVKKSGHVDEILSTMRAEQEESRVDGYARRYLATEIAVRCGVSHQMVDEIELMALGKIAKALAILSPHTALENGAVAAQLVYIRGQKITYDNCRTQLRTMREINRTERGAA